MVGWWGGREVWCGDLTQALHPGPKTLHPKIRLDQKLEDTAYHGHRGPRLGNPRQASCSLACAAWTRPARPRSTALYEEQGCGWRWLAIHGD
jgi:hypothetical protein